MWRGWVQMVEDIDNASGSGRRRIIFLTNAQAELIATQPDAIGIKRLIQALEIPKPKLVISIISSWGFAEFTACQGTPDGNRWEGASADAWKRGMVQGRSPFVSEADERSERRNQQLYAERHHPARRQNKRHYPV